MEQSLTDSLLYAVAFPFAHPLLSNQRIYFLYLLSALIPILIVYMRAHQHAEGGPLKGFFQACFPKKIMLHRSAIVDYQYYIINRILMIFISGAVIVSMPVVANFTAEFLTYRFGVSSYHIEKSSWLIAGYTLVAILAMDFSVFITHYMQHKVPLLWEFHKVHHSAEVLTPITVYRMHPVDDLFSGTVGSVLGGLAAGSYYYLSGHEAQPYSIMGVNAVLFLFYLAFYNLRHTHFWLPYPKIISHIFVSPAMHQIHHSDTPKHFDKNMGLIFSFWDGLFGTLYVPRKREEISFGIGEENQEFKSVWRLYLYPFLSAGRLIMSRIREQANTPLLWGSLLILVSSPAMATTNLPSVYLEELTWAEIDAAIHDGYTNAIIPTGGTEQNGRHVVLGKHNYIIHYTTGEIAKELGNTLVAPVVRYVPEGSIDPPNGHMNFSGTLSVSSEVFGAVLEYTARSLHAHGFKQIYFIGDSGGNQYMQEQVAAHLNEEWGDEAQVLQVGDYYSANGQTDWLLAQGETNAAIGSHAGIRDTSELMAVYPDGVRDAIRMSNASPTYQKDGSNGNPTHASIEYGEQLLKLKIQAALRQIRAAN